MDQQWLDQCSEDTLLLPPFDRYIYGLPNYVVKRRLQHGEVGFSGHIPDFTTLEQRDENEILALELVRKHTTILVPKLVYQGAGFNVFERLDGIVVHGSEEWEKVNPRQREAIRLQVRDYIQQLSRIPFPAGARGVRSLVPSGHIFHTQLHRAGPFDSTRSFLKAYAGDGIQAINEINADSVPVFAHMDWDLSNIVLYPNLDAVMGVIDWERACYFPEGGRSIHQMCIQQQGWETLFDGMVFPTVHPARKNEPNGHGKWDHILSRSWRGPDSYSYAERTAT